MQIFLPCFCILLTLLIDAASQKVSSYKELQEKEYHPNRIRTFYKKAVSMLSQDRLHAAVSYYGIGAYASQDFEADDVAMEVPANYTISSFDKYFPYFQEIDKVFEKWENRSSLLDQNFLKLLINFNYLRYVNNTNRFFKIFFDTLPIEKNYLPFWDPQSKAILKKIINDPLIDKDLFYSNFTILDMILEDIKRELKKLDPVLPNLMLSDKKVEEATDVLFSRSIMFSIKGWKVINNLTKSTSEDDLHNLGYIVMPGADAINYERISPEHRNVEDSQIKFEKGRVVIKAGRKFKKGEEFYVNYDVFSSVYEIFKRYGFVPLESLHNNMVFKVEYLNMTEAPRPSRLICLALGACVGSAEDEYFQVVKYTNMFQMAYLNIERLNHWYGLPFTENKMIEIYDQIMHNRHSNLTEAMALSRFTHSFYGLLLYQSSFQTDIDKLIQMYNKNEERISVKQILTENSIKVTIEKEPLELHDRFREILKYCLVHHHMVALNTREAIARMGKVLDNLFADLKKDVLENIS